MDRLAPQAASRLSALEADLRPSNLPERVRAMVLGNRFGRLDLEDIDIEGDMVSPRERLPAIARELGAAVATHDDVFADLLPDLLRGGNQAWVFGRGLASASPDLHTTWARLVEGLEQLAPEQRNIEVLMGFLAELWERDGNFVQHLLDSAVDHPALVVFLPVLHSAVELDERGVQRLKRALSAGQVPVRMYRALAFGGTTDRLAGDTLKDLLLLIADQTDGFDVALEILSSRLHLDSSARRRIAPELLEAGRELLRRVTFGKDDQRSDYELAVLAKVCLSGPNAGPIAAEVAVRLRQAVVDYKTYSFNNENLLTALLELQPIAVLNALFAGDEDNQWVGITLFDFWRDKQGNPADAISCEVLIAWCEKEGERRYPLAASFITFAHRPEANGFQVWSEQAQALLVHAPNPKAVLAVLIQRFQPMIWSGSRAAVIEANAQLLDSLEAHILSGLTSFVTEAKAQLAREIARMRQEETEEDRARDERFEW
jgi:hypothetical protein